MKGIPVRDWKSTSTFWNLASNSWLHQWGFQHTLVVSKVLENMIISRQAEWVFFFSCKYAILFFGICVHNTPYKYHKPLHLPGYSQNTCGFSSIRIALLWISVQDFHHTEDDQGSEGKTLSSLGITPILCPLPHPSSALTGTLNALNLEIIVHFRITNNCPF